VEYLLDASALLAWLNEECGAHEVESILDRSAISTVNLSETIQKSLARGVEVKGLSADLEALGISPVPFDTEDAENAATLWMETKELGLSLGDRACLATALKLGLSAVTADNVWANIVDPRLKVMLIR
jgi:PIN domain nuclease of toxin-antitoxin system